MGQISLPDKVKLFIGIISVNKDIILKVKDKLTDVWGDVDSESDLFDFNLTTYYKDEMGEELYKKFFSFKKLIKRDDIIDIKIRTNKFEEDIKISKDKPGRDLNLDPGYVTLSSIALASTKDFYHRIYVGKGIFMENTMVYRKKEKSYMGFEWTYPDFQTNEYIQYFLKLREIYHKQLKFGEELEGDF